MNTQTIHQNTASGLAIMGGQLTMSSREIAELTGKRHDHVMRDIKNMLIELKEDLPKFGGIYFDAYGREQSQFLLPKRETLILVSGYSVELRARIIDRWQELEQRARLGFDPNDRVQLFEQLLIQAKENEALQIERDEAIRTKALIGSRREATAMATASAAKREAQRLKNELGKGARQATIMAVERAIGEKLGHRAYVPLRRWCKENGVEAALVPDDRYGEVRAWPAEAWMHCYDIDLGELFGEKA